MGQYYVTKKNQKVLIDNFGAMSLQIAFLLAALRDAGFVTVENFAEQQQGGQAEQQQGENQNIQADSQAVG